MRGLKPIGAAALVLAMAWTPSCASGPTSPSDLVVVTFVVADETFRVELSGERQIAAARAAQAGGSARIPIGRIVSGTGVNRGWNWHLEDVEFAEFTIELCDGRPSDVERQGTKFGGGRFCPWNARVLTIVHSLGSGVK